MSEKKRSLEEIQTRLEQCRAELEALERRTRARARPAREPERNERKGESEESGRLEEVQDAAKDAFHGMEQRREAENPERAPRGRRRG